MKIGDLVVITEVFDHKKNMNIAIDPAVRQIIKTETLPSMGRMYLLKDAKGNTSSVWYYEEQLTPAATNEEIFWKTWGGR